MGLQSGLWASGARVAQGPKRGVLGHFGPFWAILGPGSPFGPLEPPYMGLQSGLWALWRPSGALWRAQKGYLGLFGAPEGPKGPK